MINEHVGGNINKSKMVSKKKQVGHVPQPEAAIPCHPVLLHLLNSSCFNVFPT